jgi:hypothetical protein
MAEVGAKLGRQWIVGVHAHEYHRANGTTEVVRNSKYGALCPAFSLVVFLA